MSITHCGTARMILGLNLHALRQRRRAPNQRIPLVFPYPSNISRAYVALSHCPVPFMRPYRQSHSAPSGVATVWVKPPSQLRLPLTACTTFFDPRHMFITYPAPHYLSNILPSLSINFRELHDGTHSVNFHILWTKTTKNESARVILMMHRDTLCPCAAFKNHLAVNHDIPDLAALFAYRLPNGSHKNMIKHVFLGFTTSIWQAALLVHVLGHSFWIGGAVKLLLAGVPTDIVATTSGWTSLAFLLYWRRMEDLLPMSTSCAYNKSHIDSLAQIFKHFRINHHIAHSTLQSL